MNVSFNKANQKAIRTRSAFAGIGKLALISFIGVAIFVFPILFTTEYYWGSGTDIAHYQYPHRSFAFSWLKQGIWPLWNPFIFNGVPFQTGVHPLAYPGTLLGLIFNTGWEIKITVWIHISLALFFMAALLSSHRYALISCLLGGCIYALSGFTFAHLYAGHLDILTTAAYLPLIFLSFDVALRYRGGGWTVLAVMALSLMLLTGHYQIIYISLFGVTLFTFTRTLIGSHYAIPDISFKEPFARSALERGDRNDEGSVPITSSTPVPWKEKFADLRNWAFRLVLLGFGSALLTMFQLLPMLESIAFANRSMNPDFDFAVSFGVPPVNWLTYLMPDFFGGTSAVSFWAYWSPWEGQGYLGIATLFLLVILLLVKPLREWLPFAVVILATTLFALGEHTPFFRLWFHIDPLLGRFRVPSRFLLIVTFFGAWAAAYSLNYWVRHGIAEKSRRIVIAIGSTAFLFAVIWLVLFTAGSDGWWSDLVAQHRRTSPSRSVLVFGTRHLSVFLENAQAQAGLMLLLGATTASILLFTHKLKDKRSLLAFFILILLCLDLFIFASPRMGTQPASRFAFNENIISSIKESVGPQRIISSPRLKLTGKGAAQGVSDFGGYDTLVDRRYNRAVNLAMGFDYDKQLMGMDFFHYGPFWEMQGVKYLVSAVELRRIPQRYRWRFSGFSSHKMIGQFYLYENAQALPRAFIARQIETVSTERDAWEKLTTGNGIPSMVVLWTDEAGPVPRDLEKFTSHRENADAGESESVSIRGLQPNKVEINVDLNSPGILVLTDAPFPGWRVFVDDIEKPMHWINGGLHRAVALEAGNHRIEFNYWPSTLSIGLAISSVSLLILLGFLFRARRLRPPNFARE